MVPESRSGTCVCLRGLNKIVSLPPACAESGPLSAPSEWDLHLSQSEHPQLRYMHLTWGKVKDWRLLEMKLPSTLAGYGGFVDKKVSSVSSN